MKNLYLSLITFLLLWQAPDALAQNISYTISVISVSWTGNYDSGGGNDRDPEEYGLTGLSGGCASAQGNDGANWTGSIVLATATNVSASSTAGPFALSGIENDNDNEPSSEWCLNNGSGQGSNQDVVICNLNFSIPLANYSFGITDVLFSCGSGNNTTRVVVRISKALFQAPLPITLTSFQAQPEGEGIALSWTTASEIDNDFVAVERSTNGLDFDEIGRIAGKGTVYEPQSYSFLDRFPLPGINYYRLRQVDFDGTFEYHPVISVDFQGSADLLLKTAPNPASDELQVSWRAPLYAGRPTTVALRVFNTQGSLLLQGIIDGAGGVYSLPVGDLPSGIYLIQLSHGGRVKTERFVKE